MRESIIEPDTCNIIDIFSSLGVYVPLINLICTGMRGTTAANTHITTQSVLVAALCFLQEHSYLRS